MWRPRAADEPVTPHTLNNLHPPPQDIVQECAQFGDGVPASLLERAIAPRTKEGATMLSHHFLGEDRVGPANVHAYNPDGMLAQAVAGTCVDPPIPVEMQGLPMMLDAPPSRQACCECTSALVFGDLTIDLHCSDYKSSHSLLASTGPPLPSLSSILVEI